MTVPMAQTTNLTIRPVPYPDSVGSRLREAGFGVIITGVKDINSLSPDESAQIKKLLYEHSLVVFEEVDLTPTGQWALTAAFDPAADEYGHGPVGRPDNRSVLHNDLRNLSGTPVQLIGNGVITDDRILQGIPDPCKLKHPSHQTFHKTQVSDEDSAKGFTLFYRWHIDAALYQRDPPKVTTLYGLRMPTRWVGRYAGRAARWYSLTLVSESQSAVTSGKVAFDLLSDELKSLAVRLRVQCMPHPYVAIGTAKSRPTGLGMESDGLETAFEDLPPWEEKHVKIYPACWKNPATGNLHLQVHPSGVHELLVNPLPAGADRSESALYPDGAHLTDLETVRNLLYLMQRPGIAPEHVFVVDWKPKQLALFHNRGCLHSITGAFEPDEVRAFWQCNLASTDVPAGPSPEDLLRYAC